MNNRILIALVVGIGFLGSTVQAAPTLADVKAAANKTLGAAISGAPANVRNSTQVMGAQASLQKSIESATTVDAVPTDGTISSTIASAVSDAQRALPPQ